MDNTPVNLSSKSTRTKFFELHGFTNIVYANGLAIMENHAVKLLAHVRTLVVSFLILVVSIATPETIASDPKPPTVDVTNGALLVKVKNQNEFESIKEGNAISTDFDRIIWFYYGVRSGTESEDTEYPGALLVRATRYYDDQNVEKKYEYSTKVTVYRGEFYGRNRYQDEFLTHVYNGFHSGRFENLKLRNDFHGIFPENENTLDPTRRSRFLFEDANGKKAMRTYLLQYRTTAQGSWIDFWVDTKTDFNKIDLVIVDLASPELSIRRFTVKRERQ